MEPTKRCGSCGQWLNESAFNFKNRAKGTLQSYCKPCANAAWRQWYSVPENKKKHLEMLRMRRRRRISRNKELILRLKATPCTDCGGEFPPEAMDFDHLHGKEDLISKLVYTAGDERLLQEVAKCEVVCSNCHRTRTTQRLLEHVK